MTRAQRIALCKTCDNRAFSKTEGIICGLTEEPPTFEGECADYKKDEKAFHQQRHIEAQKAAHAQEEDTAGLSAIGITDGVTAGVLCIVGAVAWFFAGIFFLDSIFFYPIVLLVVGITVIAKGVKKKNEAKVGNDMRNRNMLDSDEL